MSLSYKRNEVLIPDHEAQKHCVSDKKKDINVICSMTHLYEMFRIGKLVEIERSLPGPRGGERGSSHLTGMGLPFWGVLLAMELVPLK